MDGGQFFVQKNACREKMCVTPPSMGSFLGQPPAQKTRNVPRRSKNGRLFHNQPTRTKRSFFGRETKKRLQKIGYTNCTNLFLDYTLNVDSSFQLFHYI
jgi:hypothetical protein